LVYDIGMCLYAACHETAREVCGTFLHMNVTTQVEVRWVIAPCSDIVGYRRFGGSYRLHIRIERSSETLVPVTSLHGVRTQKTTT
jgi:hypothetical protein